MMLASPACMLIHALLAMVVAFEVSGAPVTNSELRSHVQQCRSRNWNPQHQDCMTLSDLDTSEVTDMSDLFQFVARIGFDISRWDTSKVRSMEGMFLFSDHFNQDISRWDTSSVISMRHMFDGAISFNQNISRWDTSKVSTMAFMFSHAHRFNQDLSQWDVSSVTDMSLMFAFAVRFNGDLSTWDVSNVRNMERMFDRAEKFNSDISAWQTGAVERMRHMFDNAYVFNVNLCSWDTSNLFFNSRDAFRGQTPKLSFCDVDECLAGTHTCGANFECHNTDLSFFCQDLCEDTCVSEGGTPVPNRAVSASDGSALGQCLFIPEAAEAVSWSEAEENCQMQGGHLASITSEAENELVYSVFKQSEIGGSGFWIGMREKATESEGEWIWADGTPFAFSKWSESQPDDWQGDEDCGHMRTYWSARTEWNDLACDRQLPFVCAKKYAPPPSFCASE